MASRVLRLTAEEAETLALWIDGHAEVVREDAYYGDESSQETERFLDRIIAELRTEPETAEYPFCSNPGCCPV